jgi:hypothetical protein
MPEYYVCLDTSVLIDVFDEIRSKGSEPKGWTALKKLIDANEAKLLVPEITLLEFDKKVREAIDELETEILTVEGAITSGSLKERVGKSLKRWRFEMEQKLQAEAAKVRDWLTASKPIEFTEAISHSTYRRVIARKFYVIVDPNLPKVEKDKLKSQEAQWLRDQDCAIIESLIAGFKGNIADRQLVFATSDYKGFGPIKKETGTGSLDESFREGLPPTQLFNDLEKLVEFVKSEGAVVELSREDREQIEREEAKEAAMQQQIAILQAQVEELNRLRSFSLAHPHEGGMLINGVPSEQFFASHFTNRGRSYRPRAQGTGFVYISQPVLTPPSADHLPQPEPEAENPQKEPEPDAPK